MQKAQVVIQTAFLGDLILTIPFLQRIKKLAPSEKLVIVCKKGLGSFLNSEGIVDEFIEIEKNNRASYRNARGILSSYSISYIYCIHRSIRSVLLSAQLKADCKVGFSSTLGFWIFDESFDYEVGWPDAIRKFSLLSTRDSEVQAALSEQGFDRLNLTNAEGRLSLLPPFFKFAALNGQDRKRQVCLFPGSVWATKRWTVQGYTEVAREFAKQNFSVLLLGGADEKLLCEQIADVVPQARVLAGSLSIEESLKLVAESELVVANDSAACHMAAYKGTPVVALFGPTVLELGFRPWSDQARVVQKDLDCRPCGKHGHQVCPLGHHHCMQWITANEVLEKCAQLLNSR